MNREKIVKIKESLMYEFPTHYKHSSSINPIKAYQRGLVKLACAIIVELGKTKKVEGVEENIGDKIIKIIDDALGFEGVGTKFTSEETDGVVKIKEAITKALTKP